jgi:streptothricin acetyltransferase
MGPIDIEERSVNRQTLEEYFGIPSWFDVESELVIEVKDGGFGGMALGEKKIDHPYRKYYDQSGEPFSWLKFNTTSWVIFLACEGGQPVGAVTLAGKTPELRMLNGRDDLADVWDIRVHPDHRHQGIGTGLFRMAIDWSRREGYRQLCVETQNVNVPACRFYHRQGCRLGAINRYAYYAEPALAEEVQLIWFLDLE